LSSGGRVLKFSDLRLRSFGLGLAFIPGAGKSNVLTSAHGMNVISIAAL